MNIFSFSACEPLRSPQFEGNDLLSHFLWLFLWYREAINCEVCFERPSWPNMFGSVYLLVPWRSKQQIKPSPLCTSAPHSTLLQTVRNENVTWD